MKEGNKERKNGLEGWMEAEEIPIKNNPTQNKRCKLRHHTQQVHNRTPASTKEIVSRKRERGHFAEILCPLDERGGGGSKSVGKSDEVLVILIQI